MATSQPTPNVDEIVSEIRIAAPPERVFEALVDPSQVVQWWGQQGIYRCTQYESDLRVGGRWRSLGVDGAAAHSKSAVSTWRSILLGVWLLPGSPHGPATSRREWNGNSSRPKAERY